MLERIRQIAVNVKDLERAVRFYRDVLEMKFLFQAPPQMAFFDCGGVRLTARRGRPAGDRSPRVDHLLPGPRHQGGPPGPEGAGREIHYGAAPGDPDAGSRAVAGRLQGLRRQHRRADERSAGLSLSDSATGAGRRRPSTGATAPPGRRGRGHSTRRRRVAALGPRRGHRQVGVGEKPIGEQQAMRLGEGDGLLPHHHRGGRVGRRLSAARNPVPERCRSVDPAAAGLRWWSRSINDSGVIMPPR